MAAPSSRPVSPLNVVIDTALCVAAFALFFWLATTHVPAETPLQIAIWSSYAAACMTGVFWIAWQMLKAVYRHQRAEARVKD